MCVCCGTLAAADVCVCAADEEGAVSPAMMAPYLGHFSPSGGELLTALASSTHTNKQQCHGINTSVDRIAM